MSASTLLRKDGWKLLLTVTGRRKARPDRPEKPVWRKITRDGKSRRIKFTAHYARPKDRQDATMPLTATLGEYTLTNLPLPDRRLPEEARYRPKAGAKTVATKKTVGLRPDGTPTR